MARRINIVRRDPRVSSGGVLFRPPLSGGNMRVAREHVWDGSLYAFTYASRKPSSRSRRPGEVVTTRYGVKDV